MSTKPETTEFSNAKLLEAEKRFKVERLSGRLENDVKVDVVEKVLTSVRWIGIKLLVVIAVAMGVDQYNRTENIQHQQMVTEGVLLALIAGLAILAAILFFAMTKLDLFAKRPENHRSRR